MEAEPKEKQKVNEELNLHILRTHGKNGEQGGRKKERSSRNDLLLKEGEGD
jgi:hypothetical protein